MKKTFSTIMAAALMLVSCSENNFNPEDNSIRCTVESISTRTALFNNDGRYDIYWEPGDVVAVKSDAGTTRYSTSQSGTTTATFSKKSGNDPAGELFTAYYPEELADGYLPYEQKYRSNNIYHSPMIASSTGTDFQFRNICGILKLNLTTSESYIKVTSIELMSDVGLSGDYSIVDGAAVVSGAKGISLNCGMGVSISTDPRPFHFSVPAGDYTNFTIIVRTSDHKAVTASLRSGSVFEVKRSQICELNMDLASFEDISAGEGRAILMNGTEVNERIKELSSSTARVSTMNSTFKKIEFKTGCFDKAGVDISDPSSEVPVYASLKNNVVTIYTPAAELYTNESPAYMFYYMSGVTEIVNLKALNTENGVYFNNMFHMSDSLSKITSLDLSNFNTGKGFNFKSMFNGCSSLTELDLSSFDTSNGSYFSYMFDGCLSLKSLDLSNFNTSKAITMEYMFRDCQALESVNLSSFDTRNVNCTKYMFCRCKSLKELNIDSFTCPKVTSTSYMFSTMDSIEVISMKNFSFKSITTSDNMQYMFYNEPNLKEIYFGADACPTGGSLTPSSFFLSKANAMGFRTASNTGKLDIWCSSTTAKWLVKTNLRWINSGYSGQTKIPVTFHDYQTGAAIKVTWAAN